MESVVSELTLREFRRRNFSLAAMVLKVTTTSPFSFRCRQWIAVLSMSALTNASNTDLAVVVLLGVKKALFVAWNFR